MLRMEVFGPETEKHVEHTLQRNFDGFGFVVANFTSGCFQLGTKVERKVTRCRKSCTISSKINTLCDVVW